MLKEMSKEVQHEVVLDGLFIHLADTELGWDFNSKREIVLNKDMLTNAFKAIVSGDYEGFDEFYAEYLAKAHNMYKAAVC